MERNIRALENGKVSANPEALAGFALRGPHDRVEGAYKLTSNTLQRLGLSAGKASPLSGGGDNYPSLHDLIRWLDGISKDDTDNVSLLKKFHNTLAKRL